MEIDLTSDILIEELYSWMDGGSITLKCRNKKSQNFEIEFTQYVSWEILSIQNLPGRIYLNKELIDQRSELEQLIIKRLEDPKFLNPSKIDESILNEMIEYIKSEEYILNVKKVKTKLLK